MGHAKHAKPLWNSIPIEIKIGIYCQTLCLLWQNCDFECQFHWKQRCGRRFLDDQWKHFEGLDHCSWLNPSVIISILGKEGIVGSDRVEDQKYHDQDDGNFKVQIQNKQIKQTVHMIVEQVELTSYHLGDSQYNCLRIPTRISLKTNRRILAPSRICCLPFLGRNPTL